MDHDEGGTDDSEDRDDKRTRYRELLEELRVVIPGVQVLFAFLLTVPFGSRFNALDMTGKRVFGCTLMLTALSAMVLLTPAAYHRIAPRRDRTARLRLGEQLAVAGLMLLGLAIVGGIWVVIRFIFGSSALAHGVAGTTFVAGLVLWIAVPLLKRADDHALPGS